ncbi:MAG: hypothetical protein KJO98_04445 [Rhodothermia bacterium]|nr:hypothetical protein [Rhodothermia bacterium]
MKLGWLPDSLTTDVAAMAEMSLLWGLDGVVLRAVDGDRQQVPFVNERRVRERLLKNEVEIVAVEPGLFEGDLGDRSEWLNEVYSVTPIVEFCGRMGCRVIQASAFSSSDEAGDNPDLDLPFRKLVEQVQNDIVFAIKNDIDSRIARTDQLRDLVLRLLQEAHKPVISASWCPASSLLADDQPAAYAREMASMASIVRCRDLSDGLQGFVPFGAGVVPWPEIFADLAVAGFDGTLVLDFPPGTSRSAGLRSATLLITTWRRATAATER